MLRLTTPQLALALWLLLFCLCLSADQSLGKTPATNPFVIFFAINFLADLTSSSPPAYY